METFYQVKYFIYGTEDKEVLVIHQILIYMVILIKTQQVKLLHTQNMSVLMTACLMWQTQF